MKYIIVTGGVMSGIGKGITASSIGVVLKFFGYNVTALKIDPYLNLDAGTMSPFEHGECYVLTDGSECDLDLGNYERFLDIKLSGNHNITSGKIYQKVISQERAGKYLGETVQIVPHFTDEVKRWIKDTASVTNSDICIIELGGTVGDIESMPFVDTLRQMSLELRDSNDICFVHVAYAPVLKTHNKKSFEIKTKPIQNSVKELRRLGINLDIICVRCETDIPDNCIYKISDYCQVAIDHVILNPNISNIYQIPLIFHKQNIFGLISKKLDLEIKELSSTYMEWQSFVYNFKQLELSGRKCKVAIIGKYTGLYDSYLSLLHGIKHAAYFLNVKPLISFVESTDLDLENYRSKLKGFDAIIIPGGFGVRGIDGMVLASSFARENDVPILGICLGMQTQVIDIGRNVINIKCNSSEFDRLTPHPVITIINKSITKIGGSMKLGLHSTLLTHQDSKCYKLYSKYGILGNKNAIDERHRHRYEFNLKYTNLFENNNTSLVGIGKDGSVDIIEFNNNKFFVGCQFHPEYNTHHNRPNPLFIGLILSTLT